MGGSGGTDKGELREREAERGVRVSPHRRGCEQARTRERGGLRLPTAGLSRLQSADWVRSRPLRRAMHFTPCPCVSTVINRIKPPSQKHSETPGPKGQHRGSAPTSNTAQHRLEGSGPSGQPRQAHACPSLGQGDQEQVRRTNHTNAVRGAGPTEAAIWWCPAAHPALGGLRLPLHQRILDY